MKKVTTLDRSELIEAVTHYTELNSNVAAVLIKINGDGNLLDRVGQETILTEIRENYVSLLRAILPNAIESAIWGYGINYIVAAWQRFPNTHSEELIYNRLSRELPENMFIAGTNYNFNRDIGVSFIPEECGRADELLAILEIKAVRDKHPPAQLAYITPVRTHDASRSRKIEASLFNSEFKYEYTAIGNLVTGKVCMLSATLMWDHPEQGRLLGKDTLAAIDDRDYLFSVWRRLLPGLCNDLRALRSRTSKLTVVVPVPLSVLTHGEFASTLQSILSEYSLKPRDIALSIDGLERGVERGVELRTINKILEALIQQGIDVHLQDAGGRLEVAAIRELSCTHVTTAPSIARTISNPVSQDYLEFLIRTLSRKGAQLICSGVENKDIQTELQAFGVSLSQGGLYGEHHALSVFLPGAA